MDLHAAIEALRRGELVGIPTETVYGLAGDATNAAAVARIFSLKQRPVGHPLIVHIAASRALERWASDIPAHALALADAFWPGPLTLVLRARPSVSRLVTGGADTVALRVPNHPIALELLARSGLGLAAPSANLFGRVSPTTATHVSESFGEAIAGVVDGGPCGVGVESTVVDLTVPIPRVLRPGGVTREQLARLLGEVIGPARRDDEELPPHPGQHPTHYAPSALVEACPHTELDARVAALQAESKRVAVLATRSAPSNAERVWIVADDRALARKLYDAFHVADRDGVDVILVAWDEPEKGVGVAIADRVRRASTRAT